MVWEEPVGKWLKRDIFWWGKIVLASRLQNPSLITYEQTLDWGNYPNEPLDKDLAGPGNTTRGCRRPF